MTTAGNQANICTYKHTWTSHIVCSALHTATINQNKFSHTSKSCVEIKAKLGKLFMAAPHYTKTTPIHWIQSIVCTNLSKCNASLNICHFFSPFLHQAQTHHSKCCALKKKYSPCYVVNVKVAEAIFCLLVVYMRTSLKPVYVLSKNVGCFGYSCAMVYCVEEEPPSA